MRAFGRRALTRILALLFGLGMLAYGVLWMDAVRREPGVATGALFDYSYEQSDLLVASIAPGSAADRAGLRVGDHVVALDGDPPRGPAHVATRLYSARPGDTLGLLIQRSGEVASIAIVLEPQVPSANGMGARIAFEAVRSFPVPFIVVGLAVLVLRVEDRNAWLLALLFASFMASAPLLPFEPWLPAGSRGFALAYKVVFSGVAAGVFLFLFSVFPTRSPLDRRLPWLKHVWLASAVAVVVPAGILVLYEGRSAPLFEMVEHAGGSMVFWLSSVYSAGGFALGLLSLVWSALRARTAEARRRSRVILWGALLSVLPGLLVQSIATVSGVSVGAFHFWVWVPVVIALALFPVSLAYAIVKHRVLEIPVLLRRSARYLLVQRGSVGLLVLVSAGVTSIFSLSVAASLEARTRAALPVAITLGVGFGIALLWAGRQVQRRLRERIDRAFFRGAYDAQRILQDLAERARRITDRRELAHLMERHVRHALLPRWLLVYVRGAHGPFVAYADQVDVPRGAEMLSSSLPILDELARRGRPWEPDEPLDPGTAGALASMDVECLVPMIGRDGQARGVLVLGPRLSEEPYSSDDRRLLASVGDHAGLAIESLGLAEEMAVRIETERRARHEMELARQVQVGLLPKRAPLLLPTLECVGECVQTRAVGGDYFDFVDIDRDRLGLVLADISGKGFPAALLMASLQASLRSRPPDAFADLPEQLAGVNQLLCRYSAPNRFATLFFGLYDNRDGRLRYANCGHNPPMLLRRDGRLDRLMPTAAVLGLIDDWECATAEVTLVPGDLLAIFSDGVTEAFSDDGEEFGEERLAQALGATEGQPLIDALGQIIETVMRFSGVEQDDDLTLLLARRREPIG